MRALLVGALLGSAVWVAAVVAVVWAAGRAMYG